MNKFIAPLLIAALTLASCAQREIFSEFVDIPDTGWDADSMAVFNVNISDPSILYDLSVAVRNDQTYKWANLWLFIDIISPSGATQTDTIECTLADQTGQWLGSGFGNLVSLEQPYRKQTRFAEPGTYTFHFIHGMREPGINGIRNIGLIIKPAQTE